MRSSRRFTVYFLSILSYGTLGWCDTIDHYLQISNNIPTMEMKADPEAQAWARSAKNVLIITNESIAETILEANRLAKEQAHPLFCLPPNTALDASTLKALIEDAFPKIPGTPISKNKLTVSQIAWLAVTQHYPCGIHPTASTNMPRAEVSLMQHDEG